MLQDEKELLGQQEFITNEYITVNSRLEFQENDGETEGGSKKLEISELQIFISENNYWSKIEFLRIHYLYI